MHLVWLVALRHGYPMIVPARVKQFMVSSSWSDCWPVLPREYWDSRNYRDMSLRRTTSLITAPDASVSRTIRSSAGAAGANDDDATRLRRRRCSRRRFGAQSLLYGSRNEPPEEDRSAGSVRVYRSSTKGAHPPIPETTVGAPSVADHGTCDVSLRDLAPGILPRHDAQTIKSGARPCLASLPSTP